MPVTVPIDKVDEMLDSVETLTKVQVLVGVPATDAGREIGYGKDKKMKAPINNAAIAYIQEFGSPAQNIPARPFLLPGIRDAKEQIGNRAKAAALTAMSGDKDATIKSLHAIGLAAQSAVRKKISTGPFTPLADATLEARVRSGKAKKGAEAELARRDAGLAPGTDLAKPLIHTGQLRRSINYVLRGKWF